MAAVVVRHERALLRIARQASLCHDDALDAYQRALEIFVRRVETVDPATEVAWLKVVIRHEAMAIRRARSESVAGEDFDLDEFVPGTERSVEDVVASGERVRRSAEALRSLKADEATALMMKAHGLSYEEIGERNGWTYTNVMATMALFVGLGGTSYALVSLPRNSVGAAQLRPDAVGRSEIRKRAVRSAELNDRTIRLRDISVSARQALQGQTGPVGPPGPTFFATIDSAGGKVRGNATGTAPVGVNGTVVSFSRSMANCVPTASLTSTPGGPNPTSPPTAHVTVRLASLGRVLVETWSASGVPTLYPVNLVVAC